MLPRSLANLSASWLSTGSSRLAFVSAVPAAQTNLNATVHARHRHALSFADVPQTLDERPVESESQVWRSMDTDSNPSYQAAQADQDPARASVLIAAPLLTANTPLGSFRTFYKRQLPSPPATAFSSAKGAPVRWSASPFTQALHYAHC